MEERQPDVSSKGYTWYARVTQKFHSRYRVESKENRKYTPVQKLVHKYPQQLKGRSNTDVYQQMNG